MVGEDGEQEMHYAAPFIIVCTRVEYSSPGPLSPFVLKPLSDVTCSSPLFPFWDRSEIAGSCATTKQHEHDITFRMRE